MTAPRRVMGSFRDPSGQVFHKDGRIFRTVTRHASGDFESVAATGLLDELAAERMLVPWARVSASDADLEHSNVVTVLEHERLEFVSYPYEWSFGGLKAAALLHLDIQLRALSKNVGLSDASAYNVQFNGPRPIFIDHLSFKPYVEGEFWSGHRQFCDQFLNPLLLRSYLGVSHNDWYRGAMDGISGATMSALLPWRRRLRPRVLTHVVLPARLGKGLGATTNTMVAKAADRARFPRRSFHAMLGGLRKWILGLRPKTASDTLWSGYSCRHGYTEEEVRRKRAFVAEFAARTRPAVLWDIGCNTGDYAKTAIESGARSVIGFELDPATLERAFERAVAEDLRFLPLYLDVVNPSPSQGWNQAERDGLIERRNADGLLALAILHHICISRNVPLADAVRGLIGHAPRGVIEFIPKNDPMVGELLRLRVDIFDRYTDEDFDAAITANARVVRSEALSEGGRRLIWYDRS